ncbi:MAG: hypothetical protein WAU86_05250 [Oricola sp.]
MISLEDCLGFCDLTEEEILAIAEHEHMPEIVAVAYGQYLAHAERGAEEICRMIVDDIREAQRKNDRDHVLMLLHVLHHFLKTHPEAEPDVHPWRRMA